MIYKRFISIESLIFKFCEDFTGPSNRLLKDWLARNV